MGETVEMVVSLTDVENSLSGFLLTLSIENETLAQIVAVEFPDYSDPVSGMQLTVVLPGSLPGPPKERTYFRFALKTCTQLLP